MRSCAAALFCQSCLEFCPSICKRPRGQPSTGDRFRHVDAGTRRLLRAPGVTIPLWRRCAIVIGSLLIAALLFRPQLATALIVRGDDALRAGDRIGGLRYYYRALAIDANSTIAADRLAFNLAMRRTTADAKAAIDIATIGLARTPDDPALLADRGFAEQCVRRWRDAERDFGRAAEIGDDARYDHFAGRIALVRGHREEARRYFRSAVARDAHFDPARVALERLR
jgi:tetratricopeptide (TPR) repeat protein